MSHAQTQEVISRIAVCIDDLHAAESHLREQRSQLVRAASRLVLGEALDVVVNDLRARKVWVAGSLWA